MAEYSHSELEPVLEALRRWALGHPRSERPFLVVRGRAFSPKSFLIEAQEQSRFAAPFLEYIFDEARRLDVQPKDFIDRAIRSERR